MHRNRIFSTIALSVVIFVVLSMVLVAQEPRYGGTLIITNAYSGNISMDPIRIGTERAEDLQVIFQAFEGLVRYNLNTLEILPAVAEVLPTVSDDMLTYTFRLRRGVKFQNGREVTAHDFKYSFERLMNPNEHGVPINILENMVGASQYLEGAADSIEGIKVLDDYTLQITLANADVDFLYKLASPAAAVVPEEEVDRLGCDFSRTPVSVGPFRIVSWIGNEITLEAFDDYYGGRPYLDRIIMRTMLEDGTRMAAFRTGEVDTIDLPLLYSKEFRGNPEYQDLIIEIPQLWTRNLYFNCKEGPFVDKRVRQAWNYAIDNKTIIEKFLQGSALPCVGYVPSSLPSFDPTLLAYNYNPELAKALMKDAGYEDGLSVEVIGNPTSNTWGLPYVEAARPYLEAVGFKLQLVPLESAARHTRRNAGECDAGMTSTGGVASPLAYISRFRSQLTRAQGNFAGYFNPRFDYFIDLAQSEPNFEKRMDLIRKAESILVDDAPIWFCNYAAGLAVHQPWVHGLEPCPLDIMYLNLRDAWIDENSPRASQ